MALFGFLSGKNVPFQDPFFGEMTFHGSRKGDNYVSGKYRFQPTGHLIEVFIETAVADVSEEQRSFFKEIENNYLVITQKIAPVIESVLNNWKEDFTITDFNKEFVPHSISLHYQVAQPVEWGITFKSDHDKDHDFELTMKGWEANGILIDG